MKTSSIAMDGLVCASGGRETWRGNCDIPRHSHFESYAALVLSGGYEETGTFGRYHARAGQVLLHRVFDAHFDRFRSSGACVLNFLLDEDPGYGFGTVADPDAIARLAESDPSAAAAALKEELRPLRPRVSDWPDLLAHDLLENPGQSLALWAERHGLAPETLSRGFAKVFATSPAAFRAEARTRSALARIARGVGSLATIAAEGGFADQAHMTRAVTALTGRPPGYWARFNRHKTAKGSRFPDPAPARCFFRSALSRSHQPERASVVPDEQSLHAASRRLPVEEDQG